MESLTVEESERLREWTMAMREAGMIDLVTSRLISETDGVFGLRQVLQVVCRTPKMGGNEAMRSVVAEFPTEEERQLVRNVILMLFEEDTAKEMVK
jgi:hypothetical protein